MKQVHMVIRRRHNLTEVVAVYADKKVALAEAKRRDSHPNAMYYYHVQSKKFIEAV